jgi:hypothetical protein
MTSRAVSRASLVLVLTEVPPRRCSSWNSGQAVIEREIGFNLFL